MDVNLKNKFFNLFVICILLLSCSGKNSDTSHQITVVIRVIDSETGKARIHDRVVIREVKNTLFSMRQFIKVGEYNIDSKGEVTVPVSKDKGYRISVFGNDSTFGSDEFEPGQLKDMQKITIEIIPFEKKEYSWIK